VTGGARLSPPPDGYAGAGLLHVVSVRFGDEGLRRVRALAVIFATTPDTVIREACSLFLSYEVSTPGYHQAFEACRRRTSSGDGAR
jgi:hypothetical protein